MKKKLAFVLSGGGSRGALQAGALRALLEAGYQPDLVTGTSIGAANGAILAVHGFTPQGAARLEEIWRLTASQDLLPSNLWWETMRSFFKRSKSISQDRVREFAISSGLAPGLRFKDFTVPAVYVVAADLNSGGPVVFGLDPDELVLDSVLASMTLPPWMMPLTENNRLLIDGSTVSNLPIETAIQQGAEEIIALDLLDPTEIAASSQHFSDLFAKLNLTVQQRQTQLELELAQARGVPVRRISLTPEENIPIWDFRYAGEMIERGYRQAAQAAAGWQSEDQRPWWRRFGIEAVLEDLIETL